VSVASGVTIKVMRLRQTAVFGFRLDYYRESCRLLAGWQALASGTASQRMIIGRKIGHLFEDKIEIVGGLVLILICFKILLEQTLFQAA